MSIKSLIESLSPIERKAILALKKGANTSQQIEKLSDLKEVEISRALQWLSNKEILKVLITEKEFVSLDKNGIKYAKEGLPEIKFQKALKKTPLSMQEIIRESNLSSQEVSVCIGIFKRNKALETTSNNKFKLTKELNFKKQDLLKKLNKIDLKSLSKEEKLVLNDFKKRKGFIKQDKIKLKAIKLTKLGEDLLKQKIESNVLEVLTPKIIKDQSWKTTKFRKYDIKAEVPTLQRGKRHFVNQAIQHIKRIWLDLGFEEMEGDSVQTAFWDMDTLFVPQDHPAREMQDTFFLSDKNKILQGTIPKDLAKRIKATHENGWTTGSKGWGGDWKESNAKEVMLRTHTTVLSAKYLSNLKKENLPKKFFSVSKVYRNETLDWKHLFEFYQVEGIVVDPNANFRHLIGYLKEFYTKMGYEKIRIRPAYFPYTSFSCEVEVFHPQKKEWMELGGAGIFRPEVTKPLLGFECPVLAWGQGMERGIMEYFKLNDLRDLYKNDLKQIREMKGWMM